MKVTDIITEAANPAQQAAIAISMKKAGKKPKTEGMAEGWQGELAGGTIGGIAGNLAGIALGGPIGGIVGGAVGGAGGGIIGRELTKEEQLNELAPVLAAGARLVMTMAPKIAQVLKSTGKATAKAAAPVAKSGAEIAAKNADKIGVGLGAYEIGSSAADIAKAITAKVGTALKEKTIMELAQVAFKFAIPAGIVLAILYGGKKVIDSLFSNSNPQQGVAEGSVTPDVNVSKVHDDGHEKEWHIYRGKEMIGYVIKNQPDTAEGLYIAYGHGPGRAFVEEFTGLKPAVNYIASLKEDVAEDKELAEEFDLIESIVEQIAEHNGVDAEAVWEDLESLTEDELYVFAVTSDPLMEDWQKANKRDKTDGMSQKAVNAYRRENPGSKLKTAVTTKPSKLKKGGKASKRRKSYCSRSRGQMKMHSISCAKTPDKAICKARRRWNC